MGLIRVAPQIGALAASIYKCRTGEGDFVPDAPFPNFRASKSLDKKIVLFQERHATDFKATYINVEGLVGHHMARR